MRLVGRRGNERTSSSATLTMASTTNESFMTVGNTADELQIEFFNDRSQLDNGDGGSNHNNMNTITTRDTLDDGSIESLGLDGSILRSGSDRSTNTSNDNLNIVSTENEYTEYEDSDRDGSQHDPDDEVNRESTTRQQQIDEVEKLVSNEIRQVRLWRNILFVTFVVVTILAVSVTLFMGLLSTDENCFDSSCGTSSSEKPTDVTGSENEKKSKLTQQQQQEESGNTIVHQVKFEMMQQDLQTQFIHMMNEVNSFRDFVTSYVQETSQQFTEKSDANRKRRNLLHNSPSSGFPLLNSIDSRGDVPNSSTVSISKNRELRFLSSLSSLEWPYVTIPGFETLGQHIVRETSIRSITLAPLITADELSGWSNYSVQNQQKVTSGEHISPTIFYLTNTTGDDNRSSKSAAKRIDVTKEMFQSKYVCAPFWQSFPIPDSNTINYNILSSSSTNKINELYDSVIQTHQNFTIGKIHVDMPVPRSILLLPIFERVSGEYKTMSSNNPNIENKEKKNEEDVIVAIIIVEVDWFKLIQAAVSQQLISSSSSIMYNRTSSYHGFTIVLRNSCGQSYSFMSEFDTSADGDVDLHYVGIGDHHNTTLDDQEYVISLDINQATVNSSTNEDFDFAAQHCSYSMSLYPKAERSTSMADVEDAAHMESDSAEQVEQRSSRSLARAFIAPSIVAISFFALFMVFLVFDAHVRRKFRSILKEAAQANKILSSLFPSNVRDRLFRTGSTNGESEMQNYDNASPMFKDQLASSKIGGGNKSRQELTKFLDGEMIESNNGGQSNRNNSNSGLDDMAGDDDDDDAIVFKTKPIADLFPEVTIMFTDMVGFTAWSSVREPHQVFTLLEAVYHAFDQIAKKRRVFKVETVGDSYVAVAGLPEPRSDHATVMARFAHDCLKKVQVLTKKLEVVLGPDTGDLTMRCGLHSGPVTAGVLRGERSRFQLFGDTMNTASRMESTGVKDKIQISQETADQLIAAGKVHWLTQREDKVIAKGKGEVETYWLNLDSTAHSPIVEDVSQPCVRQPEASVDCNATKPITSQSQHRRRYSLDSFDSQSVSSVSGPKNNSSRSSRKVSVKSVDKNTRMIDWNVEILLRQLKLIAASRTTTSKNSSKQVAISEGYWSNKVFPNDYHNDETFPTSNVNATVLDEVREVIHLPGFNAKTVMNQEQNCDSVELEVGVERELRDYVALVARMYKPNPFHSFEHASHVAMSVSKLLSRVVQPSVTDISPTSEQEESFSGSLSSHLTKASHDIHCFSYGIASDPLTRFACLFSALIHDVDHDGVPNSVLLTENPSLAHKYKGKSLAEQNSVDVAWNLLMQDQYKTLRRAIYANSDERTRFRQLVVNAVMATDIMDSDLIRLRNERWDKAFSSSSGNDPKKDEHINRKATIVIEHLIQASDVAHTMQHWHVYQKWNERLFVESLIAYRNGRTEHDPSIGWYERELNFFDRYVIPLAKKLKECGVFGVSSEEYLNYAQRNRDEFAERGKCLIEDMLQRNT